MHLKFKRKPEWKWARMYLNLIKYLNDRSLCNETSPSRDNKLPEFSRAEICSIIFSGQWSELTFSFRFEIVYEDPRSCPYLLCSDISIKDADTYRLGALQAGRKIVRPPFAPGIKIKPIKLIIDIN